MARLLWPFMMLALVACTGNPLGGGKDGSEVGADYQPGLPTPTPPPASGSNLVKLWNFANASDYDFDSDFISIASQKATLKTVDQVRSGTEFSAGDHVGTAVAGGVLKLDATAAAVTSLAATWAPKFTALKAHWKMDNDWQDASGQNHHGAVSGNATFNAGARVGTHAGIFDGTGDYVTTDSFNTAITTKFTYVGWVWLDALALTHTLIGWSAADGPQLSIESNNKISLLKQDTGVIAASTGTIPGIGAWHHVALTYAANGAYAFYLNGEPSGTGTSAQTFTMSTLILGSKTTSPVTSLTGRMDDFAVFSEVLTPGDVSLIYHRQKQKYSGIYTSPVINLGAADADWTTFKAVTTFPFFKELPGASGDEGTPDYTGTAVDLTTGLVGLWHFSEAPYNGTLGEVKDFSGKGHHGSAQGGAAITEQGKYGRGITLNAGAGRVEVPDHGDFDNTAVMTWSVWLKAPTIDGTGRGIISKRTNGSTDSSYGIHTVAGKVTVDIVTINDRFASNTTLVAGRWYLVTVVYNGGLAQASRVQIYINGVLDKTGSETSATIPDYGAALEIGRLGGSSTWIGQIDEVAIWRRALSAPEIAHLYRRGANRVKYQIRTCDDAACDTETWKGPNNAENTFFSELQNWTTIEASAHGSGAVRLGSLDLTLDDFTPAGLTVPDNPYFQYRILLESEENSLCASSSVCLPEVTSIAVGPGTSRIYGGSPSISNKVGVSYDSLSAVLLINGGTCSPTYQISQDGTDYYFWNGSAWTLVTAGVTDSSSAVDVQNNLTTFAPTPGAGNFFFKSFLTSDMTQACELTSIQLDYVY